MKNIIKVLFCRIIVFILLLSAFVYYFYSLAIIPPTLETVELLSINEETEKFSINAFVKTNKLLKNDCYYYVANDDILDKQEMNNFTKCENNICKIKNMNFSDEKYLFLKYKNGNVVGPYNLKDNIKNKIFDIDVDNNVVYMFVNEAQRIKYNISSLFSVSESDVILYSDNDNIASIKNGVITGNNIGTTNIVIKVNEEEEKIKVVVTDLITTPKLNNDKPFLPCKIYTKEEAELLDEILYDHIERVGGSGTRAAVVEAARFLVLEFPYKINYFAENGRLNTYDGNKYVDGEGRYYHKGLYLNESKFSSIKKSASGPSIWGCPLKMLYGENDQSSEKYYSNGLDCSGFVSWAIYNGGFDIGDIGAGITAAPAISNLGKRENITLNLIDKAKAGDIIAIDGHTAIIIGIDRQNKKVYVAESLFYNVGVNVLTFTFNQLANTDYFTYIIRMDNFYKHQGKYTDMWKI